MKICTKRSKNMSKIYQFLINRNPELMSSDYESYGFRYTMPSMNELIKAIGEIDSDLIPTNIIYKEILADAQDVTIKVEFNNDPNCYWLVHFAKLYIESW